MSSAAEFLVIAACLAAGRIHDGAPVSADYDASVERVVLVTRGAMRPGTRVFGNAAAQDAWLLFYEPSLHDGKMVCCDWVYVGDVAANCLVSRRSDGWRFSFVRWEDRWIGWNVESPRFSVTNLAAEDELDLPRPFGLAPRAPIPPPAE